MMRLWLLLAALLSALEACGPLNRPHDNRQNFFCVVRNSSPLPEPVTIRSAFGGVYQTEKKQIVPAGGYAVWVLGKERPDLLELDCFIQTAWGPPDWRGRSGWVIELPQGTAHGQDWPEGTE